MDLTNASDVKTDALINGLVSQQQQIASESVGSELGEEPADTTSTAKAKSFSKTLINILIIVIFLIGVAGCLFPEQKWFDMTNYLAFVEKFAIVFIPLIISVATGRSVKNYVEKKYNSQQ